MNKKNDEPAMPNLYTSFTYRLGPSLSLQQLYKLAEQTTNRKEAIHYINLATKLEEQNNAGETIYH